MLANYLELLGLSPDEHVGLFWKRGDEKHTAVMQVAAVPAFVGAISDDHDVYIAPNPTAGPSRIDKGRGKMTDVTRVVALYTDLDVKPGACPDKQVAAQIIADINSLLGVPPVLIIESGGGYQPIWTLEDCDSETGAKLLRRFGRLVRVVAQTRNVMVDSVFDTARVLRAPGSFNHKYGEPRKCGLLETDGFAMFPEYVSEKLDEVGIFEEEDDRSLSAEVIRYPEDTGWPAVTCNYAQQMVNSWWTEPVQDRHPWLLKNMVRLECSRRNACLTEADYQRGVNVLVDRFESECARPGDTRPVKRHEILDIRNEARNRAARKTDEQIAKEVGSHPHSLDLTGYAAQAIVLNFEEPSGAVGQQVTENVTPQAEQGTANDRKPDDVPELIPGLVEAEANFWDSRDSIKQIYEAAISRMCSPWAVLAICAVRALSWVPPTCTLPALVGSGRGSLNLFVALAAKSGGGKSSASSVARDLVPVQLYERNVGSGEGMLQAYDTGEKDENKRKVLRQSVLFKVDEIDMLNTMSSRPGSSTLSVVKTAFTAEHLSFSYVNRNASYPVLQANSYRFCLMCNVQPGKAGWIFADQSGGTPQRFMWFPASDHRISLDKFSEYTFGFGLTLPDAEEFKYPREVLLPPQAVQDVLRVREAHARGQDADLDSHSMFAREKMAFALALLDGRVNVTLEDWELSGVVSRVSALCRDWVQQGSRLEREREALERGEMQGLSRAVAEETRTAHATQRGERVAMLALTKIQEAGPDGLSDRELVQAFNSRDRAYLQTAKTGLAEAGLIRATPGAKGGTTWVTA